MKNTACKRASKGRLSPMMLALGASSFILLATAGVLGLSSCASTPEGLQREEQLFGVASNTLSIGQKIAPYVPAPANTVLEGLLGVGGTLLALWSSHLHRSIRDLQNGNSSPPTLAPPGNT